MSAAIVVGLLVFVGVYLVLQRELVRAVLGFMLLGHAANVVLLSAGGLHQRQLPLVGEGVPAQSADPLPQAFALTAIVITFAITVYLLALSLRIHQRGQDDALERTADKASSAESSPESSGDPGSTTRADLSGQGGPEQEAP